MLKMLKYKTKRGHFDIFKINSVLGDIPLNLRCESAMSINNNMLSNFTFFKSLNSYLLGLIISYLHPVYLYAGEYIYHQHDSANESKMF